MDDHHPLPAIPSSGARPILLGLSPPLSRLASDTNASIDELVGRIVAVPEIHAEAIDHWRQASLIAREPAGPEGVRAIIGRRLVTFPQGELSDGEWAAWWSDYTETLSDLPAQSLEAGMRAWIARPDARFMPKPGELRELAVNAQTPDARVAHILSRAAAIGYVSAHAGAALDVPRLRTMPAAPKAATADDRARVRAMADSAIHELAETAAKVMPKPRDIATHGKVDETGITAEMRAVLAQQRVENP